MTKYIIFITIITFGSLTLKGQDKSSDILNREVILTVDNDALLFGKNDKYYSSGIFIKYRRLVDEDRSWYKLFNKRDNLSKAIVSYDLAHRMYTPYDIDESDEANIDRPYAGWLNLNVGMNYHFKNNATLIFNYDLGWLGSATRTDDIQIWWHHLFNMKQPNGWKYQINNTLATNFSALYQKRILKSGDAFDLIAEQFVQVGTIRNNARSGMTMRLGKVGSLDNSIYTYSKMGQVKQKVQDIPQDERLQEFYFYFNATLEYVFYNATIDGNFLGTPSEFTKESNPCVFHHTWGIERSGRFFDYRIALIFRSREVKNAGKHKYIAITLVKRFS
ncbi:lipid A deacylase LpxR family protein [Reichenbachiella sp. MALMAid0571]|uniref:lipid A deacylase LpxR family protein n=1 Tax=Reichenbachiella sp. MALMAid0571 TaxID=3143939 RepID=UPI0032DEF1CC